MEIEHQHPMGGISSHQLSTDKFLRAATEQLQSSVSPVSGCSEPLRDPAITFSWDAVLLTTASARLYDGETAMCDAH